MSKTQTVLAKDLAKNLPSHREGYSDRAAWLMACLSAIAYTRFNPILPGETKAYFLNTINQLVDDARMESLTELIDRLAYDEEKEKAKLNEELKELDFECVKTFDCYGTQAILVKNAKFIVLAFRGTEANSIQDIKTDFKARFTDCDSGDRVHMGFKEAYEEVAQKIQDAINAHEFKALPLFITGHSLGGALATIAAKRLKHHGGIAACYTYGSPMVGDDDWVAEMRVPVYRIVNAADGVTMLPPSLLITIVVWIFDALRLSSIAEWLRKNFEAYMHCGHMRYMSDCPNGNYQQVKLLYSVSFFYRMKAAWFIKVWPFTKFLSDHAIEVYKKKLQIIAQRRSP